jgi:hypothetical protein
VLPAALLPDATHLVDPGAEPMAAAMICIVDTECTGVGPDDEIWEFAARRRNDNGTSQDLHLFIAHNEDKAQQLPVQFYSDWLTRWPGNPGSVKPKGEAVSKRVAAEAIQRFTLGATLVGVCTGFDIEKLAVMMRRNGFEPKWHYFPTCVTNLAVGYLAAKGIHMSPPWRSDDISRAIGVEPNNYPRHTAMGDVLWTEAQWDVVMG